jgi:hypothetical protein
VTHHDLGGVTLRGVGCRAGRDVGAAAGTRSGTTSGVSCHDRNDPPWAPRGSRGALPDGYPFSCPEAHRRPRPARYSVLGPAVSDRRTQGVPSRWRSRPRRSAV